MNYLSLDTETGGFGLDKSLLTVSFIYADINFSILETLNLKLKSVKHPYTVTAQSLDVNKINLIEHDKVAIDYASGGTCLYHFLSAISDKGKNKLQVVGKNLHGDMYQIWDKLIGRPTWETFCSYRWIDITTAAQIAQIKGRLPSGISGSLESLTEYFKIPHDAHEAESDAKTTLLVLQKLLELF